MSQSARSWVVTIALLAVVGCGGKADLETENAQLKERVTALEAQNAELRKELDQVTRSVPRFEELAKERRGLQEQLRWLEKRLVRDGGPSPDAN